MKVLAAAAAALLTACTAAPPQPGPSGFDPREVPLGEEPVPPRMSPGERLLHWPVNLVLDLFDVFQLNLGAGRNDYPLGASLRFTKLLRLGVLEHADFELFGLNHALHGKTTMREWTRFDPQAGDYEIGAELGAGAGASGSIDLYEVWDFAVGAVTLNLANPLADHERSSER